MSESTAFFLGMSIGSIVASVVIVYAIGVLFPDIRVRR